MCVSRMAKPSRRTASRAFAEWVQGRFRNPREIVRIVPARVCDAGFPPACCGVDLCCVCATGWWPLGGDADQINPLTLLNWLFDPLG